jgi:hypothetical protein
MTKTVLWSSSAGDIPADLAFKNNFAANRAPTVNDDVEAGYSAGSSWIYGSAIYTCVSAAAGAASWVLSQSQSSGGNVAVAGNLSVAGLQFGTQAAPVAKTVTGTLTAANLLVGIITVNQGAGEISTQTLPTGTQMEAALPATFGVDSYFDFSIINTSTVDAEDAALASPGASFTIVGSADIPAHSGITIPSSARYRVRKTATNTFVAYRIA